MLTTAHSLLNTLLSLPPYLLAALALTLTTPLIMPLLRRNSFPVANRLVLITGGSSGMGLALARLLASKGAHVIIVARSLPRLESALEQIRAAAASPTQHFTALSADMTSPTAAADVLARAHAWWTALGQPGTVDIVWQCAGGTRPGFFKDTPPTQLAAELNTNYLGAAYTAHAAIRHFTAHPHAAAAPRIVFTSSVLAFVPLAGYAAYAPAKAALRNLADCLRQECRLYGIDVRICMPATIYSPGFEEEQRVKPELTKVLEGGDEGQTPEEVARVCLRRLERGGVVVTTNAVGRLMMAGMWGASAGMGVLDVVLSWVAWVVWGVVGRWFEWQVGKYRRDQEKAGKSL